MTVEVKYAEVLRHVADIAKSCGRDPTEITVVAVTKNHTLDHSLPAYHVGCRNFGENRVQEALSKMAEAPDDVRWHLIGTLQRKKVKGIIGKFSLIHSVDSIELAEEISRRSDTAGKTTNILLQANCSREPQKHGLLPEVWKDAFPNLLNLPGINIKGLMTMAALSENQNDSRQTFQQLRLLRDQIEEVHHIKLPELSMGMSNDYTTAIQEGATILRVGSAIFSGV